MLVITFLITTWHWLKVSKHKLHLAEVNFRDAKMICKAVVLNFDFVRDPPLISPQQKIVYCTMSNNYN
jgi:hypothetical protein